MNTKATIQPPLNPTSATVHVQPKWVFTISEMRSHRARTLYTRVGPVTLLVPQTRDGSFSTDIFKRYQRSEQAFVLALMEMVVQGVSTRKVSAITEELCGASFSKSTVRLQS